MSNYQRSYRLTFGVPEQVTESYTVNLGTVVEVPRVPRTATAQISAQSIPAGDIIQLSNLPQDGASLRGLTFTFESQRANSTVASKAEKSVLNLYNLNEDTLAVLNQDGCKVLIEAGYGGSVSLIYTGDVITINPKTQGSDVITRVVLQDLGMDTKNTRISVDFDETMSMTQVIDSLIGSFPTAAKGILAIDRLNGKFFTGGVAYQGNLIRIIEKICAQNDLVYSIWNGVITVQENQLIQGTPSYALLLPNLWQLTPDTIKTIDASIDNKGKTSAQKNVKRGVVLSTFLIPINIAQFFNVPDTVSKSLAGTYKITKLGIKLNSRTGPWDTELRGEPL